MRVGWRVKVSEGASLAFAINEFYAAATRPLLTCQSRRGWRSPLKQHRRVEDAGLGSVLTGQDTGGGRGRRLKGWLTYHSNAGAEEADSGHKALGDEPVEADPGTRWDEDGVEQEVVVLGGCGPFLGHLHRQPCLAGLLAVETFGPDRFSAVRGGPAETCRRRTDRIVTTPEREPPWQSRPGLPYRS